MDVLQKVNLIFKDVLEDDSIVITRSTSSADVEQWDSLNHIYIVVEIEKAFHIKFKAEEVQNWDNVGELVDAIESKIQVNG